MGDGRLATGDVVDGQAASFGDLISLAVRGHPAAVAALLEHIRPMVVRYCRARLGRITGHYYLALLILRVVTGLSAEETGNASGMSAGAVRVAQHRALA